MRHRRGTILIAATLALAGVVVGVPVDDPVNPGWALVFGTGTVPGAVPD